MMDEIELVRSLKQGQATGFQELYELYGKKIFHLAYRLAGNKEDAEDIVQETFLQVCRHIAAFDGRNRLYTWIYAIAKNIGYRTIQKQQKRSFDSLVDLMEIAQDSGQPADLTLPEMLDLTRQVKEGCLTGLLACLSLSQRIAFVLHVLANLPVKDVAGILEKSEPATKVLIHRARTNLKNFLCRHCSLYDPDNTCRCQNLIGFSFKQGWIEKPSPEALKTADTRQIEQEIQAVRNVVHLYQNLAKPEPVAGLAQRVQDLIKNEGLLIFSNQK